MKGLVQPVQQGLGGFVQVPLDMAAEPGSVVEYSQRLWRMPITIGGNDTQSPGVKIKMP
jgi:hypothetical protein